MLIGQNQATCSRVAPLAGPAGDGSPNSLR